VRRSAGWRSATSPTDFGQAIAAAILTAATVPTATSGHTHTPAHQRWREVAWLVVGIDQYGWLRDAEPLSERTISTRLAAARTRAHSSQTSA
jgi:hypothetical protein